MNNEELILKMLTSMQENITAMQTDIASMRSDITVMQADIVSMKSDIAGMQADIVSMKSDIAGMQADIVSMKSDIKKINGRLDTVERKLDNLTEAHEETRSSVNAILEWSDRVSSIKELHIPRI